MKEHQSQKLGENQYFKGWAKEKKLSSRRDQRKSRKTIGKWYLKIQETPKLPGRNDRQW